MNDPKFNIGELVLVTDSAKKRQRLLMIRSRQYSTLQGSRESCWNYLGDLYELELKSPPEESSVRYVTTVSGCDEDRLEKRVI